jgi:adenine-specific DNA-methyltransferase
VEFLRANRFLTVDTALVGENLKAALLASQENLDETLNGLLIHSDNFHALNLMRRKLREQIRCIYIDPPYNTGSDGFLYRDAYRHSSWLSMMDDRLQLSHELADENAALFVSLDDNEQAAFKRLADGRWGEENFIATAIWQKIYSPKNSARHFSEDHDFVLVYAKNAETWAPFLLPRTVEMEARYSNRDNDPRGPWKPGDLSARNPYSEGRYSITCPSGRVIPGPPPGTYWRVSKAKFDELNCDDRIWWGEDGNNTPSIKRFLTEVKQGRVPQTIWPYSEVGHTQDAKKEMLACIGLQGDEIVFQTPKPTALLSRVLALATNQESRPWVLDYFAGSGTTAHAVIQKNRNDGGQRRYAMVEMGEYFYQLVLPRTKKAGYSKDWKNGKPVSRDGISHCFKYLRLESYEDTLNNLLLPKNPVVDVENPQNSDLARDYLLKYWLDFETAGSPSLLNVRQFADPTTYRLKVKQPGSDAQVEKTVDLIETFNWLIGLHVAQLDRPRRYAAELVQTVDPDLPKDQDTRWTCARIDEQDEGEFWFRWVEGHVLAVPGDETSRQRVLVLWRKLTSDAGRDQAVLEAYLAKKKLNPLESEFETIYINGSHALPSDGNAATRVRLIEETFAQRMWEDA